MAFVVGRGDGLTLVSDGDSVLVFDMEGTVPEIRRNMIIVGTGGAGYVRRIKSASVEGRRLFVRASPAYLSEAVEFGQLDTTIVLGFNPSALSRAPE